MDGRMDRATELQSLCLAPGKGTHRGMEGADVNGNLPPGAALGLSFLWLALPYVLKTGAVQTWVLSVQCL